MSASPHGPLRVGVGGPVGSGKTALVDALCKRLRDRYDLAVITNDIYTREDAEFLTRSGALAPERIAGVETGGCPHTAIREDASINLAAIDRMRQDVPAARPRVHRIGRRQSCRHVQPRARRPHDLRHRCRCRRQDPRKGGPGITRSDLLVINKIDLAPLVGADLGVMARDARRMRGERPFVFTNIRAGDGVQEVADFIRGSGGLGAPTA